MNDESLRRLALAAKHAEEFDEGPSGPEYEANCAAYMAYDQAVAPANILALLDRLAAAERDAERYRHLRDVRDASPISGADLDASIDAAIKGTL